MINSQIIRGKLTDLHCQCPSALSTQKCACTHAYSCPWFAPTSDHDDRLKPLHIQVTADCVRSAVLGLSDYEGNWLSAPFAYRIYPASASWEVVSHPFRRFTEPLRAPGLQITQSEPLRTSGLRITQSLPLRAPGLRIIQSEPLRTPVLQITQSVPLRTPGLRTGAFFDTGAKKEGYSYLPT